ncbi:MAG: AI-2E family transporter [Deferribacteres bacterium]|nr:AI-2E family transporter [candidate division KSB1 bacterium]MCB9509969.1 AI-2E family transporter [Deferribacteres bacterium]
MPGTPKKMTKTEQQYAEVKARRMGQAFLLVILIAISFLFFKMLWMFLMPVFLAAVFTALTYPFYEWLLRHLRGNRGLSAFFSCLLLILLMLGPVYFIVDLLRGEAVFFYQNNSAKIQQLLTKFDTGLLNDLKDYPLLHSLGIDLETLDYQSYIQQAMQGLSKFLLDVISRTKEGFAVILDVVIILFTMYYFYKDGPKLISWLKYLSPLDDQHEDSLIERFVSVSRATIKGTLVIGLTQGTLGGITLWLFGFSAPVLWGMVMVVLSVIPMVGAWAVLFPAAIIMMVTGSIWKGVAIILITSIIIGNVDNLLRPKLVGRDTGMHDLLIFFSTIGGLSLFGLMGFIVGPVIAVLFLTVLNIYSIEFKPQLDLASSTVRTVSDSALPSASDASATESQP